MIPEKLARPAALLALLWPLSVANAAASVDFVLGGVSRMEEGGRVAVEVLLVNDGPTEESVSLPDRIEARIVTDAAGPIELERAPGVAAEVTVPGHGFRRARYRFAPRAGESFDHALISIPSLRTQQVAFTLAPVPAARPGRLPERGSSTGSADMRRPGFLGELSEHEPVYAAYGSVADSEVKIQISFKYRLFGKASSALWDEGLHVAFTQLMLWDRAGDSEFRDVNYVPEIFYRSAPRSLGRGVEAGLQAGAKHESNGRSGPVSRSLNNVYLGSAVRWDMGGGYFLQAEPRLTFIVGGRHDNPDIRAYRGVTGLRLRVGREDGLQLAANGRLNFSNGRGSLVTQLTYPLSPLLGIGPQLYLFGENFVGYGESLRDYDRRMTRLRAGIAVVR